MSRTLRRAFGQFTRTASCLDMRTDAETRKARAQKYERKNKTNGKRAQYELDCELPQPLVHGLADQRDYVDLPPMGY